MDTSSPKNMIDIASLAVGAVGKAASDEKILRLFYQDFARPGVKQVGKALSTVLNLGNTILLPVKMANAKANALYIRHMESYRKNLEEVPEEKIIEVSPEIGGPILEKLGTTINETISQMYINLLTTASHIDLVSQAHPRFISVIESLTQDEALILNQEAPDILFITVNRHIIFTHKGQTQEGVGVEHPKVTKYHKPGILNLPENAPFYFDNLLGLGLLAEYNGSNRFKVFGDAYAELKQAYATESMPSEFFNDRIEIIEGRYERTPFCNLFLKACKSSPKFGNTDSDEVS